MQLHTMWRPVLVLRSIVLPISRSQGFPQFPIFCDACRLKIIRRQRQYHSSTLNLARRSKVDDDDDEEEEDDDQNDDEDDDIDVDTAVRFIVKYVSNI